MFFWLVLLTFFSSLLIYGLYPRNDGITIEDKPEANVAVADLLTQHLAAVDAAEILFKDGSTRTKAYVKWVENGDQGSSDPYEIPDEKFEDFLPAAYIFSDTQLPVSEIYCIKNNGRNLTKNCGVTSGDDSTTDFLVTYIKGVPVNFDTYIAHLAHRSLGVKMFLTKYVNDSREDKNNSRAFDGYSLKTNCGIVRAPTEIGALPDSMQDFDPSGTYVLDNTRYYTVRVPALVSLPAGSLACITRLSATYTPDIYNNLRIVYPKESKE